MFYWTDLTLVLQPSCLLPLEEHLQVGALVAALRLREVIFGSLQLALQLLYPSLASVKLGSQLKVSKKK